MLPPFVFTVCNITANNHVEHNEAGNFTSLAIDMQDQLLQPKAEHPPPGDPITRLYRPTRVHRNKQVRNVASFTQLAHLRASIQTQNNADLSTQANLLTRTKTQTVPTTSNSNMLKQPNSKISIRTTHIN